METQADEHTLPRSERERGGQRKPRTLVSYIPRLEHAVAAGDQPLEVVHGYKFEIFSVKPGQQCGLACRPSRFEKGSGVEFSSEAREDHDLRGLRESRPGHQLLSGPTPRDLSLLGRDRAQRPGERRTQASLLVPEFLVQFGCFGFRSFSANFFVSTSTPARPRTELASPR